MWISHNNSFDARTEARNPLALCIHLCYVRKSNCSLKFLCTAEWSDGVTKGVYLLEYKWFCWMKRGCFHLYCEEGSSEPFVGRAFDLGFNHKYNYLWMAWWFWDRSWAHTRHTNQMEGQNLDIYGAPAETASKTIGYII